MRALRRELNDLKSVLTHKTDELERLTGIHNEASEGRKVLVSDNVVLPKPESVT